MEVCNRQPLVEGKGVHCEMGSEGSRRQNSAPRNTNRIRHNRWDELAQQSEVQRLHGHRNVNTAGIPIFGTGYGVKVCYLTAGGLTDVWKQSKKHGQNKFIVRNQPKP